MSLLMAAVPEVLIAQNVFASMPIDQLVCTAIDAIVTEQAELAQLRAENARLRAKNARLDEKNAYERLMHGQRELTYVEGLAGLRAGLSAANAELTRLRGLLEGAMLMLGATHSVRANYDTKAEAFYRDTGVMAPGKDAPAAAGPHSGRDEAWRAWVEKRLADLRDGFAALATKTTQDEEVLADMIAELEKGTPDAE